MKAQFTFLINMYNQENLIEQTLESIRYQIEHYGDNYLFRLILSDDASKDRTCETADNWLAVHKNLFVDVKRLYHTQHRGTCYNYTDGVMAVETENFQVIDGDDLLSCDNLFEIHEKYKEYDVIACQKLPFQDGKIFDNKKSYMSSMQQMIYNSHNIGYWCKSGKCTVQNGYIIKRHVYTEDVISYIRKFRLIEDVTLWYKIFCSNKKISYVYCGTPTILYRRSSGSVSMENNMFYDLYSRERQQMKEEMYAAEKNRLMRWIMKMQSFRKRRGYRRLMGLLLNPHCLYEVGISLVYAGKFEEEWKRIASTEIPQNQLYLYEITKDNT